MPAVNQNATQALMNESMAKKKAAELQARIQARMANVGMAPMGALAQG